MKVWYFHGLESKVGGPKVEFLKSKVSEVFAPEMDYTRHKLFGELYRKITKEGKPDLIIGSSMGGFFADALSSHFGIDTILLNPALHSRSMIKGLPYGKEYGSINVCLGSEDKVIDPYKTIMMLQDRGINFKLELGSHGHRTPLNIFKDIYNETVTNETS
tara:strand:+ start:218 stop:697 length:480 start_codon:yes stop_codon:yes gene_type:complete